MTIVAAKSISAFFSDVVEDAMRTRQIDATGGATCYLIELLADYAHPGARSGEALDRSLTLLLDEALHAPDAADRFERLRALGDGVLYGCGFFGDHFEARGVDPKYLRRLGKRAYDGAGSMLRRGGEDAGGHDLFAELADRFDAFASVIADVADATIAMGMESSRGMVRAYERWLKTGSDRLASALTSHGMVPTRGTKGVVQ